MIASWVPGATAAGMIAAGAAGAAENVTAGGSSTTAITTGGSGDIFSSPSIPGTN